MTRRRLVARSTLSAITVSVGLFATACGGAGDRDGDLATYCADYRSIADNNPFETLAVASPGEMRTAFDDLSEAADAIVSSAPDRLDRLASAYADSIGSLVDILSAADFDPSNLDTTAYRRATIDYDAAATALSNETVARCD